MATSTPANLTAPGFSGPQEEALLTLFRTADALDHAMQQRLKPYGITAPQYNALRILRAAQPQGPQLSGVQAQGLSCSAIGSRMITPEPDITRLLGRLKAHKLVAQKRDSRDGRVVLTHLTAAGMQLLAKLDGVVGEAPAELMCELTSAEVRELTRLLAKARGCSGGKKEEAREAAVTGHSPSLRSPRWSVPRRHPE
jgi:DNA-binding MarR family transcriptional regulator